MVKASPPRSPDALLARMGSLADATRLRLLHLLERQELGVAELVDILRLPQSTVSRHLKVLGDQGWVTGRSYRTTNLYRMRRSELDAAARRLWQISREETAGWATLHHDQLRLARRLEERNRGPQEFFAGAAAGWDKLRAELYGRAFTQEALLALLSGDLVVADLGCGAGEVSATLAAHVGRVIGVDRSAPMLQAARRRLGERDNVELHEAPLESLPIGDGECDAVLLILALSYVAEPDIVLAEAARVLRPGGKAVVVDLLRHDRQDFQQQMGQRHPGFDTDTISAAMGAAGLQASRCRELPPEPQAKGPALFLATARRPATVLPLPGPRELTPGAQASRVSQGKRRERE